MPADSPAPASPAPTPARPNCPDCGQALKRVRYEGGYLNEDQFDSVRAGDWYCTACKGTRSGSGFRYFWNRELVAPPASDAPPATWQELAEAVFPNSRPMTKEERAAFDASAWPNVEPVEIESGPASDAPAPPRETAPTRIEGGIEWFAIPSRVEGGVNLDAEEDCQCARCGSSCAWLDCGNCGGDDEALGSDCIDDLCHGGECMHGDSGFIRCDWCRGTGGSWHCVSGPAWCEANPLPGRESITSTALRADAWND